MNKKDGEKYGTGLSREKNFLKELIQNNKNIKKIPEKYLNILTECIFGYRFCSLDYSEVKELLKFKTITYEYIDSEINSCLKFINILKSKFNKNGIIIVYIVNGDSGCLEYLERCNKEIKKIKEINSYTYGMIINKIKKQPKILIIGTK